MLGEQARANYITQMVLRFPSNGIIHTVGLFFSDLFLFVCVCMYMHIYVGTRRGRRKMSDPQELELQMVVSWPVWVLGPLQVLGSSTRAARVLAAEPSL